MAVPRSRRRLRALGGGLAVALVLATLGSAPSAQADPDVQPPVSNRLPGADFQVGAKGRVSPTTTGGQLNPYLSEPVGQATDDDGWRRRLAAQGRARAASSTLAAARRTAIANRSAARVLPPALHDEEEPLGTYGSNDTQDAAEPIPGFGTGRGENPRVRVLGSIAAPDSPTPVNLPVAAEDNGSIPLAVPTGIDGTGAIVTTGVLGDGPHGVAPGDGTNDFDVYSLSAGAGATITFSTIGSSLDTVIGLYDDAGELVAANDDGGSGLSSLLDYRAPAEGTYYALVAAYNGTDRNPFPADPNDSGSGIGGAKTGNYRLALTVRFLDTDVYAVDLAAGDVLGVSISGQATKLGGIARIWRPDGTQMINAYTGLDTSAIYPPESPLPGGGDVVLAYVAEQAGTYAIQLDGSAGSYDATVEAYRPGLEADTTRAVQTIYLDFDGARVNTVPFDPSGGIRTLSPMSAFIAKWGLKRSDEARLIDAITDGVRENLRRDVVSQGLNPNVALRITNSKDSVDLFGRDNVSRVVVGGTIEQSGLATVGIASDVDPGNFAHQDSALVLLDSLSAPAGPGSSLNSYLGPDSDRLGFVARGVANVVSHEIGHLLGNYHTDNGNAVASLMDAGGANQAVFFGVGPDGLGGTADDVDVDFTTDAYQPTESYDGLENTLNVISWALARSTRASAR